ncbi:hypothetical protein EVAR_47939_1 [Eumeta japonica]|uniref:Uncharacterized protein n=1 Tax=Eumeta variegata TaxID=151549 RepID=A0A4C1Y3T9_EUMVA|nr:hypothetical protein EVAR_47939_1 [Eumeta japonica]
MKSVFVLTFVILLVFDHGASCAPAATPGEMIEMDFSKSTGPEEGASVRALAKRDTSSNFKPSAKGNHEIPIPDFIFGIGCPPGWFPCGGMCCPDVNLTRLLD